MADRATSVKIQDQTSKKQVSVIETVSDPTKNGLVITNPDGSDITQDLPQAMNDESIWLLRRLVKLLESNATVDIANRQKVVVEAIPTILGGYTVGGNGANIPTAGAPVMNPSTSFFVQTRAGPVDPRRTNIDQARAAYNLGIRSNLSFT